jgi:glycosyltransferase involved in cell wall biosynthesis
MSREQPTVLIFRKQILPYSETFIADQGRFLPHYQSYYVGFSHTDSPSKAALARQQVLVLEDYAASLQWAKLKQRLGFVASRGWLNALKGAGPDLIHAHFTKDAIDAMQLGRQLDIPFIATAHGYDVTRNDESARYKKQRAEVFRRAARIIAVSDYIKSRLLEKGCPEEKIVQHYIGIDVEKFSGDKAESATPNILFVGRLVEKKGCGYLLQAMARLKTKHPELELNIVGGGPLEKELRAQAREQGLKVNFLGRKTPEEIKALISAAWIFSTPSITAANGDAEGLGMVFLEAQALRTPVVSFASGGVVEAVEHGVSGLLGEERDVEALTNNLATFLDDRQARERFGENGRARVLEKFNIVEQCRKLEGIYQSVTG